MGPLIPQKENGEVGVSYSFLMGKERPHVHLIMVSLNRLLIKTFDILLGNQLRIQTLRNDGGQREQEIIPPGL